SGSTLGHSHISHGSSSVEYLRSFVLGNRKAVSAENHCPDEVQRAGAPWRRTEGRHRSVTGRGGRWGYGRTTAWRDESIPASACRQPGRLVAMGRRGIRRGAAAGRARAAVGRVLGVPLVPCDGARV